MQNQGYKANIKRKLDGCTVWNVHNTVFGLKHVQLHH